MGILDELRREASNRLRASRARATKAGSPLPVHVAKVVVLLEDMFSFLEHFCNECNVLEPDAAASYRVTNGHGFTDLQQRSYKVQWNDQRRGCFTLSYVCVGQESLDITVSTRSGRETMREHLDRHGLGFRIEDLSTWRYVFIVTPRVPVSIRFEPDPDTAAVRMTTRNFDVLGESRFTIDAALIDENLLDQLGRRLVRKASRFDELIGNHVSDEVREQFRKRIASRRRAREALDEPGTGKTKAGKRSSRRRRPAGQVEGTRRSAPASRRDSPPTDEKSGAPRYAWMVTGDIAAGSSSATVGKIGPSGVLGRFTLKDILTKGRHFRMRSQEGQVIYTGYITGKFNGFEPLADYGAARGCHSIEYEIDGRWTVPKARSSMR